MAAREPITISVLLELRAFVEGCVATGCYSIVSEVVWAALREFERAEMGENSVAQQAMAGQPPTPSGCG